MMEDDDQEELRYTTGSDVEIEEYTDTEESTYPVYQESDKFFDIDSPCWQNFIFLITLSIVIVSITASIISYPLYHESISAASSAYAGASPIIFLLS